MKIPYVKLYTADLLAASRNLTAQQIGDCVLALCESAFENDTLYVPQTQREEAFFKMLLHWKEESKTAYQQHKKLARKAAQTRWKKQSISDGAPSISSNNAPGLCHTETETETKPDTETETENISLIVPLNEGQGERDSFPGGKPPLPAPFVDQVIERFESVVKTPKQREIFLKNNAGYLRDILDFCDHHIPLALQTISACIDRLHKGGVTGGYSAVCRNLPEYYEKAKQELVEQAYE